MCQRRRTLGVDMQRSWASAIVLIAVAAVATGLQTAATCRANASEIVPAPAPQKLERLTDFFDNEVATGKLPGAVILIQQHGRPVYLKTFGMRDVTTGLPMTPDT